jgi:hypothetical protein
MENLTPSSAVDTKVVRPDIHEFYLQSHRPLKVFFAIESRITLKPIQKNHVLKGTGNVPQYVFPVNEVNANNDELQVRFTSLNSPQIIHTFNQFRPSSMDSVTTSKL